MAKINLSSTYEDLQEYPRVVFEPRRKISGYHSLAMGTYIATDPRQIEQGLPGLEKAALYVGLFVFRYGYVSPASHDNPKGLLITELEFDCTEALCKPCLIFVVKDMMPGPPPLIDACTRLKTKANRNGTRTPHHEGRLTDGSYRSPHCSHGRCLRRV